MSLTVPNVHFICHVIFRELIGLQNSQNFLKFLVFQVLHFQENDLMASALRHIVDLHKQCQHA